MEAALPAPKSKSLRESLFVWLIVLLVSDLPDAILQAVIGEPPVWLIWVKAAMLVIIILSSLAWKSIQPMRLYFILLLALVLLLRGTVWLRGIAAYTQWDTEVNWMVAMVGFQLVKLVPASIMVIISLAMGRRWKDFFFTAGQLGSPIKSPTSGEVNKRRHPISWWLLGVILGLCIAPLTLLFIGLGNMPTSQILLKALPYFPAALLFAATNAFAEETPYRATLLGDLQKSSDRNRLSGSRQFFLDLLIISGVRRPEYPG